MSFAEAQYTVDEVINGLRQNPPPLGMEPNNLKDLKIIGGNNHVYLHFTATDTIIDGQLLCSVRKVIIRRKVGEYPTDENDGDLVAELVDEAVYRYNTQPYMDEDVVNGTEYFYRLFPVSNYGLINRSIVNSGTATPKLGNIWGFHQDFTNLDPYTTITYLSDTVNADFTPMRTNAVKTSTTNSNYKEPTMGSWENWTWLKQNKPCIVNGNTKEMVVQLDESDPNGETTIYGNATENCSRSYQWFAWLPKIYMKEIYSADGNSRDVYFSTTNEGDSAGFIPVGFINENNEEVEGLWIPMRYCNSAFNVASPNSGGSTMETHHLANKISDASWGGAVLGGPIMHVIRDLLYMLYRCTNIQEVAGYGLVNSASGIITYPNFNQFRGYDAATKYPVSAFWSIVLLSNGLYLNDPYMLQSGSGVHISPNYKYSTNSSLDVSIYKDSKTSWATSGTIWGAYLTYYGDGLGSGPRYISPFGSSSTGLCDQYGFTASEFKMLAHGGKGSSSAAYSAYSKYGPAHFTTIYTPGTTSGSSSNMCVYAPMIIPNVGYKPQFEEV